MISFFFAFIAASYALTVDLSIDDFKHRKTNALGGRIFAKDVQITNTPDISVLLQPTSSSAYYHTELASSGCFDASAYESLVVDYKVSHPEAVFNVIVEFYDVDCKTASHSITFRGRKEGSLLSATTIIKLDQFDKIRDDQPSNAFERLKSLRFVAMTVSNEESFVYELKNFGFSYPKALDATSKPIITKVESKAKEVQGHNVVSGTRTKLNNPVEASGSKVKVQEPVTTSVVAAGPVPASKQGVRIQEPIASGSKSKLQAPVVPKPKPQETVELGKDTLLNLRSYPKEKEVRFGKQRKETNDTKPKTPNQKSLRVEVSPEEAANRRNGEVYLTLTKDGITRTYRYI